jgi:hypothetical protein
MPKITVKVPHNQEPKAAMAKARAAVEKTVNDFQGHGLNVNWGDTSADFSFTSMGFSIKGDVQVTETEALVQVELPFAALMFKDKAQKAITKNLTRAIEQS